MIVHRVAKHKIFEFVYGSRVGIYFGVKNNRKIYEAILHCKYCNKLLSTCAKTVLHAIIIKLTRDTRVLTLIFVKALFERVRINIVGLLLRTQR